MVKQEFTVLSRDGKTELHAVEWLPEGRPRAVLQIAHGVSEYVLRYEELAAYLTERGFAVVGNDHLGHGASVASGAPRVYFGPAGSWETVVDDLYALRCLAGQKFPGLPYFLLGHSMGSFLVRTYLIRYPGTVDGAILMGTGQMPRVLTAAGRAIAAVECRKIGETRSSPLVQKLAFGTYNKAFAPNRTEFDWVSSDETTVNFYKEDPHCGENPSVGLFREMLGGIAFITNRANLEKMNLSTPVLFVSGEEDPVGERGRGARRAYRSFQRAGVRDTELRLYPGARHEILNDVCRREVCRDLADWLLARLPAGREA
ncbi:alpha/beta hydrolase [Oscillibacter sp.]|uniref:alpha/beta hydrolase n=1 Tax=Oscillibacter sp. TaxID=1945593 RepID=UPI0028A130B7|nr:alpha/beta hydrolase [Oscillibacter sp.]